MQIDVDNEVYNFLKEQLIPFEESTPNDVLRRLLLGEKRTGQAIKQIINSHINRRGPMFMSGVDKFVASILQEKFYTFKFTC